MNYKTFRMWQAIIGMIIGGVVGVSIGLDNWIIPVSAIIIALLLMIILRKRVKGVHDDERTYTIAYKAARLTLSIVAIGMALIGAVLLVVSRGESHGLTQVGFAMEYTVCALLIINMLAYTYYSHKLGGR